MTGDAISALRADREASSAHLHHAPRLKVF